MDKIAQKIAQQQQEIKFFPNPRPVIVPGNIAPLDLNRGIKIALANGSYEGNHALAEGDMFDPVLSALPSSFYFSGKGKTYVVTHRDIGVQNGRRIDPYLRVESPNGAQIAFNDDDGMSLNSLIHLTATEGGTYRIVATVLFAAYGDFQLGVRETRPGEVIPPNPFSEPTGRSLLHGSKSDSVHLSQHIPSDDRNRPVNQRVWQSAIFHRRDFDIRITIRCQC